jgi:hypothetical protein
MKRPCWGYREAQTTTPYVRSLLGGLRASFISAWHYYRLVRRNPTDSDIYGLVVAHRRDGAAALEEFQRLGVLPYSSPLRGIALFPFEVEVQRHDRPSESRAAFWVFKDSRDSIDSFVYAEDVFDKELLGVERAVPEEWKELPVGQLSLGPQGARR